MSTVEQVAGTFVSDWHQPQERVILAPCFKVAKQLREVEQPEITQPSAEL